jgi:AbrB family looped-hinge helix DNA binding protein
MMTTVSTKGQLVIPAEIRERLGIEPGTKIAISVEGSRIVLQPVTRNRINDLFGIFKGAGDSAVDDLIADRRKEDLRLERLIGE